MFCRVTVVVTRLDRTTNRACQPYPPVSKGTRVDCNRGSLMKANVTSLVEQKFLVKGPDVTRLGQQGRQVLVTH